MSTKQIFNKTKYLITFVVITLLLYMAAKFFQDRAWFLAIFFIFSAGLILVTYSISKKTPSKYLVPGVLLLCLFQIYPAFYSGLVAFTNDSNGHQISKEQAVGAIIEDSRIPIDSTETVFYQTVLDAKSTGIYLAFQYPRGKYWLGNSDSIRELQTVANNIATDGSLIKIPGLRILSENESFNYSEQLQNIVIRIGADTLLQPQDMSSLEISRPVFSYNENSDRLTNVVTGEVFSPNDNGQFISSSGEILYPGWKANVGWRNFSSIVTDEDIRKPLLAVLTWTFVNAFLLIILSFLMGLILALVFNFPQLRSKRLYRTIFIFPMAIPSVLSILVWHGLFTTETGVIDRLFHVSTPWLTDSLWARVAVLIVEIWSTFPYMFLITTGAIQAIPSEILEAAEIDGASTLKSFTQIKLPLVVRTVAPLLVASVAMALNNFGAIYLLTGGGPTFSNTNGNAGATDILISYTYKLAFNSDLGANYGLASALSILNFILVGVISIYGLRKMKTMEGIN